MKAKLTPEQAETIRDARRYIRDAYYNAYDGVSIDAGASEANALCDKLSAIIGERYSFRSGEVLR